MKEIFSLKYSWDRPTTAISGKASTPTTVTSSKALPSAHPPQKSSWTRSDSRSSIASTQGSDGVSSNPLLPSDAQESFSAQATRGKEIPRSQQSVVQFTDVEMEPSLLATSPGTVEFGVKGVTETSVKTICDSSPNLSLHTAEATTSSSLAMSRMAELTSSFLMSNTQSTVNGITNPDLQITEFQSADVKSESREECTGGNSTDIQIVPPNALPAALTGESSDANQKDPAVDRPQPIPADARRIGVSVTSLPTPLPTPQPTPDFERAPSPYLPENIPTEALSIRDALRIVVMTRLLCDRQAREDRVDPVLKTNQALAALSHRDVPSSTSEKVIQEVLNGPGHEKRLGRFAIVRGTLVERFEERQNVLTEKVQHLRQEYLLLHERWLAHCANLDEQSKAAVSEPEIVQPTGRTTRRSTANLGDAVRSDLEMEQIIASLGNDEATDPNHLSLRNLATIPDMISVTHGKVDYTYDDTNHSVQNPAEYYGPHTGIDDWNEEEKKIFLDKFAAHPKQFGMIAEHLPNKTAAQCVDYYYLHKKKVIDFRKVVSQYAPNKRKRGRTGKKKGNALLADIRQHDAEVHGDFGSPRSSGRPSRGRKPIVLSESREVKKAPNFRRRSHLDLTPSAGSATPTPEPETRRRGGRRSAAAPLSRTVSVGLEDGEGETTEEASERPVKRPKRGGRRVNKSAATTTYESGDTETKIVELPELAGRRKSGSNANQWSDEDKNIFLTLLAQHGDDFKRIAASMPNKTSSQVGNYYKANCDELDLEKIVARAPQRSPTPDAFEDLPEVHTPTIAETPAREAPDEPLSLLAQKLPQTNGVPAPRYTEHPADQETSSKVPATWKPLSSRPLSPPLPTSHVRGYYSINHRPTSYYPPPPHPIPTPTYAPPVPYTYPPYTAAPYPQYDPYHRLSPYSLTDPGRRMPMPMRTRENPYPVLSQPGQPPYHYPLES
ncbi:hypothetical protein C0993_000766 [Termitomyces sp. T159_Od127]|nr:hypothetical protein C0993_000766 [Termitomyces sp. T159_Od127]